MIQSNFLQFKKNFVKNQVIEWKQLYIDFVLLKSLLAPFKKTYELQAEKNNQQPLFSIDLQQRNELINPLFILDESLKFKLNQLESQFLDMFKYEIDKANTFARHHFISLKEKFFRLENNFFQYDYKQNKGIQQVKAYYQLREYTKLLYKESFMLSCFITSNRQAIQRLILHYERKCFYLENFTKNGLELIQLSDSLFIFHENIDVIYLMEDLQKLFIKYFYPSEPEVGEAILQTEISQGELSQKISFQFGICLGLAISLLFYILMSRVELTTYKNYRYDVYFPLFRCIGLFQLYIWFLSFNVHIWNKTYINYKLIFNFPHHYSTVFRLLRRASFFTMLYLFIFSISINKEIQNSKNFKNQNLSFILITDEIQYQPAYGPLVIWFFIIVYLFMPFKIFNYEGRKYFWILLFKCFTAAFRPVEFPVFWLIIQIGALIIAFRDLYYTFCFYSFYFSSSLDQQNFDQQIYLECNSQRNGIPGLVIALIPSILSLIAQLRASYDKNLFRTKFIGTVQQMNCVRILLSVTTTVLSFKSLNNKSYFYAWLGSACLSASYNYYCDIKNDWNFLNPNAKYKFLRNQLAYKSPKFYYFVMIIDLPLRMSWTLTLSPNHFNIWSPLFIFVISSVELFRVFLWNFIRVEKDHVVNVGDFKAVTSVPLPYKFVEYIENTNTNSLTNSLEFSIKLEEQSQVAEEKIKKTIIYASEQIDQTNSKKYDEFKKFAQKFKSEKKIKCKEIEQLLDEIDDSLILKQSQRKQQN